MPDRILGIDPGLAVMGYGLVEANQGKLNAAVYGVLQTSAQGNTSQRLLLLYKGIKGLLEYHQPSEVALEMLIARNLRTALMVGQARGVAMLAAAEKGLPVYEYTPLQVKLSV